MVKEVFRLISSVALLAAVIVGVKAADKFVKQLKGEKDEDIIDIYANLFFTNKCRYAIIKEITGVISGGAYGSI